MVLLVGDTAAIVLAQRVSFWIRFRTALFAPIPISTGRYVLLGVLSTGLALTTLAWAGAYRLPRLSTLATTAALLLRAMTRYVASIALAIFLLRLGTWHREHPFLYSRFVVGVGWVLTFVLLSAWRLAVGRLQLACFALGWGTTRTLVAGEEELARKLAAALHDQPWLGYDVLDSADVTENLLHSVAERNVEVVWLAYSEERLADADAATALGQWILETPIRPARWAMTRPDFELFLRTVAANSDTPEAIANQLLHTIEHDLDPLAGPRVTFIGSRGIPATYGGVERYVEELSKNLATRGYRVSVYCRPHYTRWQGTYRGVELRRLPCIRTKHLEAISHTLLSTLHVLLSEDDIVHYQALGPSLLVWLPRILGKKTVVTVQGLDWQRQKWGYIARSVLKVGEWAAARLPHRTIVVSRALERHFRERYGRPVAYIPNGVRANRPRPAGEINQLGLEKGSYILTVGRLVPEKGYHALIRAFKKVETDKRLVVVGGTSYTEAYAAALHEMVEEAPILFTGYVYGDLLRELFSNAYLYVSASLVEGLPLALLEAMSFGTCVLASDIAPHLEMMGGAGYHFRAGDEDDLEKTLCKLLARPEDVARAGDRLRSRAAAVYNWDIVAEATDRLYQDMLRE